MKFLAITIFACGALAQETSNDLMECTVEQIEIQKPVVSEMRNNGEWLCYLPAIEQFCTSNKCELIPKFNLMCEQIFVNCCKEMTAKCLACQAKAPVRIYCSINPDTEGCEEVSNIPKHCHEYTSAETCPKDICLHDSYCRPKCNVIKDETECQLNPKCEFGSDGCDERNCVQYETRKECENYAPHCGFACQPTFTSRDDVQYHQACQGRSLNIGDIEIYMGDLDDTELQMFCGDGCGQSTIEFVGAFIACRPEPVVALLNLPPVDSFVGTMDHLCAKDFQGKYCVRAYVQLRGSFKRGDCTQFKGLSCCLGNVDEAFRLVNPEFKKEMDSEMKRCGFTSAPKWCPLAGETQEAVVITATLDGLDSTKVLALPNADLEKLKEVLIKGIAEQSGLDLVDIQVVLEKDAENKLKAVITMIPKDDTKIATLEGDDALLSKVDSTKVKEVAGDAATGDITIDVKTVAKQTNSNSASKFYDPSDPLSSNANTIVTGTISLIATALAAL